jgi:hypothetical protein
MENNNAGLDATAKIVPTQPEEGNSKRVIDLAKSLPKAESVLQNKLNEMIEAAG